LRYSNGFIWIAASPRQPGIGFYLDADPLGPAGGWNAAVALLQTLTPAPEEVIHLLDQLRDKTIVASIGIEGTNESNSRIKIYFRLTQPRALSELCLALLQAREVNHFLDLTMGSFGLDLDGPRPLSGLECRERATRRREN
jgi:hypothetical protein